MRLLARNNLHLVRHALATQLAVSHKQAHSFVYSIQVDEDRW
jgi:hypothetical protein